MRGPIVFLITAGVLVAGCDPEEPAPAPVPTPTESTVETAQEQTSIMRPEMEVERPPIPLEPLRVTIPFADGGSDLSEVARTRLKEILESDQWDQVERVILRGHSDAGGTDAANMRVSEQRAQAVADWLMEAGLDEESIRVIAFGSQNPAQPNLLPNGEPNERGRAANRRVEVTVLVPEGATIPDPGPSPSPSPSAAPTGESSAPAKGGQPKTGSGSPS
ncbi:MAG: OmpA family protein [Erythrobacter sp.]|nr:OmpA family protein [Erythrobacter sp.]NCQ63224.1 OmpA family protein [Alphaproteobacteria bacterium]